MILLLARCRSTSGFASVSQASAVHGVCAAVPWEMCASVSSGDSECVCLLFPGSPLAPVPHQRAADPFPPQQRSLAALHIISRWAFWC